MNVLGTPKRDKPPGGRILPPTSCRVSSIFGSISFLTSGFNGDSNEHDVDERRKTRQGAKSICAVPCRGRVAGLPQKARVSRLRRRQRSHRHLRRQLDPGPEDACEPETADSRGTNRRRAQEQDAEAVVI